MIDRDFVDAIVENSQAKVVTVNGKEYATGELHNPPMPIEPDFPTIHLLTLDSLVEYITANRDGLNLDGSSILATAEHARLVGRETGVLRKRPFFASVRRNLAETSFGSYQPIEDFRIYMMTRFRGTPDREVILKFITKISDEHVATSEDNGVSQSVTVRSGIATHSEAQVPSPLQLAPIRTFIEVEQPVGHFIFRLRREKDKLPTAALFELPTNWEREAAVNVKNYLSAKTTIPVFA